MTPVLSFRTYLRGEVVGVTSYVIGAKTTRVLGFRSDQLPPTASLSPSSSLVTPIRVAAPHSEPALADAALGGVPSHSPAGSSTAISSPAGHPSSTGEAA